MFRNARLREGQVFLRMNVIARRKSLALFGNGLVEAIPDEVLVGMEDPLCDDNLAFVKKIKDAKAEVQSLTFDRMPHSFFTYPELLPKECELANQGKVNFMM